LDDEGEKMSELLRDFDMETELQNALDNGTQVWVIGDVHGQADALEELLAALDIEIGDRIVMLGDLIDRGPDSRKVVRICRTREYITVLRGNHEQMVLDGFSGKNQLSWEPSSIWLYNGGAETYESYMEESDEVAGDEEFLRDALWFASLPHILELDDWILAHAGINPNKAMHEQEAEDLLWIRNIFHNAEKFPDSERTVVFGHSIVHYSLGRLPGEIGISPVCTVDGRPAWIGIDTGACDPTSGWLTALELGSHRLVQAKGDGTPPRRCKDWNSSEWVE
jgi:serine/threonine protein phosphatase 1